MGLDMYLYKKMYVGNNYKEPKDQLKIEVEGVKQERVSEITEKVGYWRKANAIHNWFVINIQDGEDDCKEYYVTVNQLQELLDDVNKVIEASELIEGEITNGCNFKDGKQIPNIEKGTIIKNPAMAKKLLPTTEGFFFGGTGYDEYYYNDLVDTKKILEEVLKEVNGDFYYSSSW